MPAFSWLALFLALSTSSTVPICRSGRSGWRDRGQRRDDRPAARRGHGDPLCRQSDGDGADQGAGHLLPVTRLLCLLSLLAFLGFYLSHNLWWLVGLTLVANFIYPTLMPVGRRWPPAWWCRRTSTTARCGCAARSPSSSPRPWWGRWWGILAATGYCTPWWPGCC